MKKKDYDSVVANIPDYCAIFKITRLPTGWSWISAKVGDEVAVYKINGYEYCWHFGSSAFLGLTAGFLKFVEYRDLNAAFQKNKQYKKSR